MDAILIYDEGTLLIRGIVREIEERVSNLDTGVISTNVLLVLNDILDINKLYKKEVTLTASYNSKKVIRLVGRVTNIIRTVDVHKSIIYNITVMSQLTLEEVN